MAEKKKQTAAKTPRSRSGTRSASGNKTAGKRAAGASRRRTGNSTVKKPASSVKKQPSGTREFIDYALYLEIILWIILAFAVLIFISFFGVGGAFGKAVSDRVFGMFGILAYLFPFVIFFLAAFLIANPKSRIARISIPSPVITFRRRMRRFRISFRFASFIGGLSASCVERSYCSFRRRSR